MIIMPSEFDVNIVIWYVGKLVHDIAKILDWHRNWKATYPNVLLYYEFSFFLDKKSVILCGSGKMFSIFFPCQIVYFPLSLVKPVGIYLLIKSDQACKFWQNWC